MIQNPLPLSEPLTEWLEGTPPMIGWWNTRHSEEAPVMRRFYQGSGPGGPIWSAPVETAEAGTSLDALARCPWPGLANLQYQGLTQPSLKGVYPYQLGSTSFDPKGTEPAAWNWEVVQGPGSISLTSQAVAARPARIRVIPARPRVRVTIQV